MATPELIAVRDVIAWSYANLACAHSALRAGRKKHSQLDWMIRAKLFRGLRTGQMKMGSLFDDERLMLLDSQTCGYCGSDGPMTIDHLIPRFAGGQDRGNNLIRACRSCNSSKGKRDLLVWYESRGTFPPILILRRYLKIVAQICDEAGLLDSVIDDAAIGDLPFEMHRIPTAFPQLSDLRL